mgnify:CR=1 FL=1
MAFGLRELRDKDLPQIRNLISNASIYSTILMRDAVQGFETFPGWWFGSLRDGTKLESIMAILDHSAEIYSESTDTVEAMASHLKKTQAYTSSNKSNRHQIRGVKGVIDPFWKIFKDLGRQLVSDAESTLMASTADGSCASKRIAMGFARPDDLGLVAEFSALRLLEEKGNDPRRQGAQAFNARCASAIADGRIVIGRDGAKPAFVAELRAATETITLLDNVFIPAAFRTRKRLIGGALFKLKYAPPVRGKELLFFADSPTMKMAAETAGYVEKAVYRTVVTVG